MANDFVQLKCPNCGGTLEVKEDVFDDLFVELKSGVMFVVTGNTDQYTCAHCGSKFLPRQKFEGISGQSGGVNIDPGANVVLGGDIIGGDKNTTFIMGWQTVIGGDEEDHE